MAEEELAELLELPLPSDAELLRSLLGESAASAVEAAIAPEEVDEKTARRRKRQREASARCRARKAEKLAKLEAERSATGEGCLRVASELMALTSAGPDALAAGIRALVTEDFKLINPDTGALTGVNNCLSYFRTLLQAVPDLTVSVVSMEPEEGSPNKVRCSWRISGTHSGAVSLFVGGIQPSGKAITVPGLNIFSFRDGKVSEVVVSWRAGLLVAVLLGVADASALSDPSDPPVPNPCPPNSGGSGHPCPPNSEGSGHPCPPNSGGSGPPAG